MPARGGRKSPARGASGTGASGPAADLETLSFEEAMNELEGIVGELEEGALPLEKALARFERGIRLSRHLEKQLRAAEARVRALVGEETEGEPPALEPFEPESGATPAPTRGSEDAEDDGENRLPI